MIPTACKTIIALDFDGVLCHSLSEHCISSWRASQNLLGMSLPEMKAIHQAEVPIEFQKLFCEKRPLLEVGYEGVLLALHFVMGEEFNYPYQDTSFRNLTFPDMAQALAQTRDAWYEHNPKSWCQASPFYDNTVTKIKQWLKDPQISLQLITKKSRRFATALLEFNDCHWNPENLFGLEDGSKEARLMRLQQQHPSSEILFFEDRLATLERIVTNPDLAQIKLFFCTWGYNNQEQRLRAQHSKQIYSIDLDDFCAFRA